MLIWSGPSGPPVDRKGAGDGGDTDVRLRNLVGDLDRRGGGRPAFGRLPAAPRAHRRTPDRALRGTGAGGRRGDSREHREHRGPGGDYLDGDGDSGELAGYRGAHRRHRTSLRGPDGKEGT